MIENVVFKHFYFIEYIYKDLCNRLFMARESALSELTLRRYEKPYNLEKRELMRKICLSLGLLQPGDSRDVIVDVLLVLEDARKKKEKLNSFDIVKKVEEERKTNNVEVKGIAESNIRRQLKRLRDLMLVNKEENLYWINEFESLKNLFEAKIESFVIPQTIERIKDYLAELEKNS